MRRTNIFLLSLSLLLISCGSLEKNDVGKRFFVDKKWVRNTLAKEHAGFRAYHRMPPILTKDFVIQGNAIDGIVAYKRKSGRKAWRKDIPGGVEAGAVFSDGKLFFGTSDGHFYALDIETGKELWKFELKFEVLGKPLVKSNTVYFISGNNIVYALSAKTGRKRWHYSRNDPSSISIRGGSQPAIAGNSVYVGFSDGFLVALNKNTGSLRWEKSLNKNKRFKDIDSHPVIEGNRLYVSSYDGALFCLNRKTGGIIWKIDDGGYANVSLAAKTVFYATTSGKLLALDKKSGKTKWSVDIKKGYATEPVLYRGLLAYGESEGALKVIDSLKGELVGEFHPGRGIMAKPTLDPETGEVFFVSVDANLYALKLAWRSPQESWPWDN